METSEWQERVGRYIERRRRYRGIKSMRAAAKEAGLSETVWRQIESGRRQIQKGVWVAPSPSAETKAAVARVLHWPDNAIDSLLLGIEPTTYIRPPEWDPPKRVNFSWNPTEEAIAKAREALRILDSKPVLALSTDDLNAIADALRTQVQEASEEERLTAAARLPRHEAIAYLNPTSDGDVEADSADDAFDSLKARDPYAYGRLARLAMLELTRASLRERQDHKDLDNFALAAESGDVEATEVGPEQSRPSQAVGGFDPDEGD